MVLQNFPKLSTNLTKWHQEKKHMRGNNMPFFNKELSSAHTKKSETKNLLSQEKILSK